MARLGSEFLQVGTNLRHVSAAAGYQPGLAFESLSLACQRPWCGWQPPTTSPFHSWWHLQASRSFQLIQPQKQLGDAGGLSLSCRLSELFEPSHFSARCVGTECILCKWSLAGVLGKSYISSDRVYSNVFLNYSWCFAHYAISFFRGQR